MEAIIKATDTIEKEKRSVGKEFVEWAEKYWNLKGAYCNNNSDGETCPYDYIINVFENKINDLIKEKLEL